MQCLCYVIFSVHDCQSQVFLHVQDDEVWVVFQLLQCFVLFSSYVVPSFWLMLLYFCFEQGCEFEQFVFKCAICWRWDPCICFDVQLRYLVVHCLSLCLFCEISFHTYCSYEFAYCHLQVWFWSWCFNTVFQAQAQEFLCVVWWLFGVAEVMEGKVVWLGGESVLVECIDCIVCVFPGWEGWVRYESISAQASICCSCCCCFDYV